MSEDYLNEQDFFTAEEVYLIMQVVNERLAGVHYHYWINKASQESLEILDFIEFKFESGNTLILATDQESDGIKPHKSLDLEAENERLKKELNGLIYLSSKDMSKTALWKSCLKKDIAPSFLQHDGKHLNDNLVLHFEGGKSIEIYLGLEGLEADEYIA